MKSQLTGSLLRLISRSFILVMGLMIYINTSANDGKTTAAVKGSVPLNYYKAFMISIAVIYGIYLIIRAKRRKRNNGRITD